MQSTLKVKCERVPHFRAVASPVASGERRAGVCSAWSDSRSPSLRAGPRRAGGTALPAQSRQRPSVRGILSKPRRSRAEAVTIIPLGRRSRAGSSHLPAASPSRVEGCLFGVAPRRDCPFHPGRVAADRLVSVALILASRRAGVTCYGALRSPDVPRSGMLRDRPTIFATPIVRPPSDAASAAPGSQPPLKMPPNRSAGPEIEANIRPILRRRFGRLGCRSAAAAGRSTRVCPDRQPSAA